MHEPILYRPSKAHVGGDSTKSSASALDCPESMNAMTAAEAWFIGGPVDGRIMFVEPDDGGSLPAVLNLPQTGVFVGSRDLPEPVVNHVYVRQADMDALPVYQCDVSTPL
jgi:hypothetical protein